MDYISERREIGTTAGQLVVSGVARLFGGMLTADVDDAVAEIYDDTAAVAANRKLTVRARAGESQEFDHGFPNGFSRGIFVVVTGNGARLSIASVP